ncbi:MAG: protein kinase [Vicinamibacterales bacterium]
MQFQYSDPKSGAGQDGRAVTLGPYRLLERIGAGGMGVVYKARDLSLGRLVALKLLPDALRRQPGLVERFRREARTASALNHPNICTIYRFDELDDRLVLAMELLEGEPLDQRVRRGAPLPPDQLLGIGVQLAAALEAAHARGIVHRDVKPANVFLTADGRVKVLDFGLAKLAGAGAADGSDPTEMFASAPGTTAGTVAYMSPEQARGEPLDARSDLFSAGVVLYELATGRRGFDGATTAIVFDGILNRVPVPPSALNPGLPAGLDTIIARALEKDRERRYQSAADMRADLASLAHGSRPVALDHAPAATVLAPTCPPVPAPGGPRARVTTGAAAAMAAVLVAAFVLGGTWWPASVRALRPAQAAAGPGSAGPRDAARPAWRPASTGALPAAKRGADDPTRRLVHDPDLGVDVPPVVFTLRAEIAQPRTPRAEMSARHRLALIYDDIGRPAEAAAQLEALVEAFPDNPYDAAFRLGTIYERELAAPDEARAAYRRVPEGSRRYADAQARLQ